MAESSRFLPEPSICRLLAMCPDAPFIFRPKPFTFLGQIAPFARRTFAPLRNSAAVIVRRGLLLEQIALMHDHRLLTSVNQRRLRMPRHSPHHGQPKRHGRCTMPKPHGSSPDRITVTLRASNRTNKCPATSSRAFALDPEHPFRRDRFEDAPDTFRYSQSGGICGRTHPNHVGQDTGKNALAPVTYGTSMDVTGRVNGARRGIAFVDLTT